MINRAIILKFLVVKFQKQTLLMIKMFENSFVTKENGNSNDQSKLKKKDRIMAILKRE